MGWCQYVWSEDWVSEAVSVRDKMINDFYVTISVTKSQSSLHTYWRQLLHSWSFTFFLKHFPDFICRMSHSLGFPHTWWGMADPVVHKTQGTCDNFGEPHQSIFEHFPSWGSLQEWFWKKRIFDVPCASVPLGSRVFLPQVLGCCSLCIVTKPVFPSLVAITSSFFQSCPTCTHTIFLEKWGGR